MLLALVCSAALPRLRAAAVSLLHALWVDQSPPEEACPRPLRSWATLGLPQLAAAPLVAPPAIAMPSGLRLLQPLLLHILRTPLGDAARPSVVGGSGGGGSGGGGGGGSVVVGGGGGGGGGGLSVAAVSDGWSPRPLVTPRGAARAVEAAVEATPRLTCAALRLVGTLARRGWYKDAPHDSTPALTPVFTPGRAPAPTHRQV